MISIIQSGWLVLALGVLLLLFVGCSLLALRLQPVSTVNQHIITLTEVPFSSLRADARQQTVAPPLHLSLPFTPSRDFSGNAPPQTLYLTDPSCYSMPNRQTMCLGRVWNNSDDNQQDVVVRMMSLAADQPLVARRVALEQRSIPAGMFAPYRVIFPHTEATALEGHAIVYGGEKLDLATVAIRSARGALDRATGRYIVTATIENDTIHRLDNIRCVVTLLDHENHVIGYQVAILPEPLQPNRRETVRMVIIPQIFTDQIDFMLHVEATVNKRIPQ